MISFKKNESFLYGEDSMETFATYLETETKRLFQQLTGKEATRQELVKLFEEALTEDSWSGVFYSTFENSKITIEVSLYTGKVIFMNLHGIGGIFNDDSGDQIMSDLVCKIG